MSKPFDMELFLTSVLTGSHATRQRHLRQANTIQKTIAERWQREDPWRWKRKHLLYFMNTKSKSSAKITMYRYELTVRLIALRMGKRWF
ncbi:hypothetical protein HBO40_18380 [Pseudomonas protegens]|uniref:hypothetical protein n=1 Tax=Pseudomonas protegens TaxID=380021 RepID=UPI001475EE80|nr:hypothetical protein [Pseudomonas protegens]NMZ29611.1 hypothetical protein [Pseudomonas protegens]NMZ86649.1 hypothetical protein [Pseudomonas protegens]